MGSISESTMKALSLLFGGDPDLWEIIGISFKVSLTAIVLAAPLAAGIAFLLAYGRFPGRRLLITAFNTLFEDYTGSEYIADAQEFIAENQ